MAVYILALVNITDRETYANYERGFGRIFRRYQGKLLAVEENPVVKEGEWAYGRTVLVEFPSLEELERWYHSDEYQALSQHRRNASTASIVVLRQFGKS